MDPSVSSASSSATKPAFACIRCSDRKVKCDREFPCRACVRHNVQCVFRPPRPSRAKRKVVKDKAVDERLKRLEALLREKGVDPSQLNDAPGAEPNVKNSEVHEAFWEFSTPASSATGPQVTIFKPQLLQGQSGTKFVDNSLWSRVAEEIHETEGTSEEDSVDDASDGGVSHDDFAYVLGWKTPRTTSLHPSAEVIRQMWRIFIENVNPLSKIVHVPSLQPAIEKAITNIERIPKGFEALMFAIYSMAVLSITKDECMEMLGESRALLRRRYVAATKAALARAEFMSSTSIVVLQALLLHIFSIRDDHEPRAVWSLTGATFRIAEGMGMRLDGTLLGLSPFETEIRRRIWWQIKMHDFRASELSGQSKFRNFDVEANAPKKPANVNDSELHPTMSQAPAESTRPTEMAWVMFRSELASFATTQKVKMQKEGKAMFTSDEYPAIDDLKIKDDFITMLEDMVEAKHLRFCDPSQPLQFLTLVMGRAAINLMRFISHHPRRWAKLDQIPAAEQEYVWDMVIKLLEQYRMVQSNPQLHRFAWNVPYFIQWHAVIHVLDTLRANPLHPDAVKAWQLIDTLYENNEEMLLNTKRPIFVAVGNLCLKAFRARVAALTSQESALPNPPEYIVKLREQRDAAKARRQAIISKSRGQNIPNSEGRSTAMETDTAPWQGTTSTSTPMSSETLVEPQPPANPVQASTWAGDDAFWLRDALDDGVFAGGPADAMNLDTDTILAQDYWMDSPNNNINSGVIDWAQWDAWQGNVEPVRSNVGVGPG